jgi:putative pyruvate formate lyase activating enzyme
LNDMDYQAHKDALRRAKLAREAITCCNLCPRQCGVDRTIGEKGYCGLDDTVRCFREMLHWSEESELIPSHQIYFAGCNLRCEFCTVAEWNEHTSSAAEMDIEGLKRKIAERKMQGARNINLLGGEPTVSLHGIIGLLAELDSATRVVLNSNMYYNSVVDELLCGLIDIYLADFKCGNPDCADAMLGAVDYVETAKQNILRARDNADVIVRHVILPGHTDCCLKPILGWLARECSEVKLSLRGDYVPGAEVVSAPKQYLDEKDFDNANKMAEQMGLNLVT